MPSTNNRHVLSGSRSVRFEPTGPTAEVVLRWLHGAPPSNLAEHVVTAVDVERAKNGSSTQLHAVELHFDTARVVVSLGSTAHELSLVGESWAGQRLSAHHQVTSILSDLCSFVCEMERTAAADHLASQDTTPGDIANEAAQLFSMQPRTLSRVDALLLTVESIDLTTLAGDDTTGRVRSLCALAQRPDPTDPTIGPTAAVCVYPSLIPTAVALTQGSNVLVASVAGAFPSGLSSLDVRLQDIADALAAGADEIDVVMNRAAFLAGRYDDVLNELTAMRRQVDGRVMKVILETSELATPMAIGKASELAIAAGADWIKTSTGKASVGATPVGVLVMAQTIATLRDRGMPPVGLKVSGGVRTAEDALGYLAIIESVLGPEWLSADRVRFGASGLLSAVVTSLAAARHEPSLDDLRP